MGITYKIATVEEIELLTKTRIEVLLAANGLPAGTDMTEVEAQSRNYYRNALRDGTHVACLALDGSRVVGTGGVSFYQVMPTCRNPSGKKAYIMNLYTVPAYRRKGIAYRTLDLLVQEARRRGVSAISLEATSMGRPLYEKYGFLSMEHEMELPEKSSHLLAEQGGNL